jgi:hypothetical protein
MANITKNIGCFIVRSKTNSWNRFFPKGGDLKYISLREALLDPGKKECEQDLSSLINAMIEIRDSICNLYDAYAATVDKKTFVNGWFYNLYKQRC